MLQTRVCPSQKYCKEDKPQSLNKFYKKGGSCKICARGKDLERKKEKEAARKLSAIF